MISLLLAVSYPLKYTDLLLTDYESTDSRHRWKCRREPSNRRPTCFRLGSRSRRFVRRLPWPAPPNVHNLLKQRRRPRIPDPLSSAHPHPQHPLRLELHHYSPNGRGVPYPRGRMLGGSSSVSTSTFPSLMRPHHTHARVPLPRLHDIRARIRRRLQSLRVPHWGRRLELEQHAEIYQEGPHLTSLHSLSLLCNVLWCRTRN